MQLLCQRALVVGLCATLLVACQSRTSDEQRTTVSDDESAGVSGWPVHGRTLDEQRYSPLEQITPDNVADLGLAWYVDLPGKRGQEATPIVVGSRIYTTSAWSHVLALDAKSGEVLWHFDPEVPKVYGAKGCCDAVNRGVAFADGKVYVGTFDGRLISLDADTGEVVWSTLTVDQSKHYTITGAPRVVAGKVLIGNGGAEFGVRGYISAYDAETGELAWRFYTVPGAPGGPVGSEPVEAQTATWNGNWWSLGGGGTVWDSMAYDDDSETLYFGSGNGSPWNPNIRSAGEGDNWFLASIIAVDIHTGTYKWHYQTVPGEAWDYTATQQIVLADIEIDGSVRKVLMQAPKNGFFYVIDRLTGELISAEPIVPVNWASHVDIDTGRPAINPEAEYWKTGKPALVTPSWMGAHNWHPMSYDAVNNVVYMPVQESAFPYLGEDDQSPSKLAVNLGVDTKVAAFPDEPAIIEDIKRATKGRLVAWDPIEHRERWRVDYPGAWNGGVLATKGGLVFQGTATGFVVAYNAIDGSKLWNFPAQTGVVAPPISFEIDGEQYIAVSVGWGGIFPLMTGPLVEDATQGNAVNRSRLLVFKLQGGAFLPPAPAINKVLPEYPGESIEQARVEEGFPLYDRYCGVCHGTGAVGGGVIVDLRYTPILASASAWEQIVLDGIRSSEGMPLFAEELERTQAESIRHYVLDRNRFARELLEATNANDQ